MNKILDYILISIMLLALASCVKDDIYPSRLNDVQMDLIGKAVNFNDSHVGLFDTKTSYRTDGSFNEGDIMTIYRQYWNSDVNAWKEIESRVYYYNTKYASSNSSIELSKDWRIKVGYYGRKWKENGEDPWFKQAKKDSLTWENGKTVRFRAWCRNNLAGTLSSSTSFYPDYSISDWVTVSGPTSGIPLALKHIASRISFDELAGNEIKSVQICTNVDDYRWEDNSDSFDHDEADKEADAQGALDRVLSVYYKMCIPAGVDMERYQLKTMTRDLYDRISGRQTPFELHDNIGGFMDFEQRCERYPDNEYVVNGLVTYGTKNPAYIKEYVKRPEFKSINGVMHLVTIPYDMSSDTDTQGEVLVLPACTRFKVVLRDVDDMNGGNKDKEHIFSLSDIKNSDGSLVYPYGISLLAGHSYMFRVGYQYDTFRVYVEDDDMSWADGGSFEGVSDGDRPVPESSNYEWWKSAIYQAARTSAGGSVFNPEFVISNAEQFREFVKLVNNTATVKTSGLARARRATDNPECDPDLDTKEQKRMYWHKTPVVNKDTVWVTRAEAEAEGYLFYRHYHPGVGDKGAYSEEDYLQGSYPFFSEALNRHYTIRVDHPIDFKDVEMPSIGIKPAGEGDAGLPFMGRFDAGMNLLQNINIVGGDGYLFAYIKDADVRNVRLETTHPLALIDRADVSASKSSHIVGISLKAPAAAAGAGVPPVIRTLTGQAYVVGCIYEGDSSAALVGTANSIDEQGRTGLVMYGCMNTSSAATGATLLGGGNMTAAFAPQTVSKVTWSSYFACNYYLREPGSNPNAVAVGGQTLTTIYQPQQYIRGARAHVLKAINDNLLAGEVEFKDLNSDRLREEFYGLAPWKAMNYAIKWYNTRNAAAPCSAHYEGNMVGYAHLYPQLRSGAPEGTYPDPTIQKN